MQTEDNKSLKDSGLNITREFLSESIKHVSVQNRKKGGPYSKKDRANRHREVYKLHFEYGYSATKISDMMKINRNTINNDIRYLYSRLEKEWKNYSVDSWWMKQVHRMETQRTRLLEQLDKEKDFHKRLALEKMIFEIDNKMTSSSIKIMTSTDYNMDVVVEILNKHAKDHKLDFSFARSWDIRKLETKSVEKILQIIKSDKVKRMANKEVSSLD